MSIHEPNSLLGNKLFNLYKSTKHLQKSDSHSGNELHSPLPDSPLVNEFKASQDLKKKLNKLSNSDNSINQKEKVFYTNFAKRLIINPENNRKLINFRMMVYIAWYIDFFLTSLLLANWWWINDDIKYTNFLNHRQVYVYIILIQGFDMILNFIIIKKVEHEELNTL